MKKSMLFWFFLLLFGFGVNGQVFSSDREKEFKKIVRSSERSLTARAKEVLEKKYSGERWGSYNFPKYVYVSEAVQVGYKIAVKAPELLAKFPCYCFCEEMGHKNLAYCFLENGVVGKFDEHASTCNICYTQALRAFLWNELGATEEEIHKAFKEIYEK